MNSAAQGAGEPPLIDVHGLTKRYGTRVVVDHFDMQVPRGRIYGFLGPNGSGKTTTIRMLCGLLTPDAGEGTCMGYDIRTQARLIKREVGYMTQRFGLYEDLSLEENLDFIARVYAVSGRRQKVDETLERLGLVTRRTQLAGALSGGWKQRLALAACLIHQPRLLLLDEPTAGVDPAARRDFWDQIHDLAAGGMTVLVSTHYMDEAERCRRVGYIYLGHLLAEGTPDELKKMPGVTPPGTRRLEIVAAEPAVLLERLRNQPGVRQATIFGQSVFVLVDDGRSNADLGLEGLEVRPAVATLEDVFVTLSRAQNGSGNETAVSGTALAAGSSTEAQTPSKRGPHDP